MSYVVVKGGTYSVGDRYFQPGSTEEDDPVILEACRNSGLRWVSVVDQNPDSGVGEQLALDTEKPQPALPTPGQKLVAETEGDTVEKTAAARIAEAVAEPPKAEAPGHQCPYCDKSLRNAGAQIAHVKHAHPDDYDAFMEKRRAGS